LISYKGAKHERFDTRAGEVGCVCGGAFRVEGSGVAAFVGHWGVGGFDEGEDVGDYGNGVPRSVSDDEGRGK